MRILGRSPQGFLIPLLLLAAGVAGCATSRHFTAGETAERLGRYDDAVVHYARAVAEDPSDSAAALSLTRAKLRAAEGHAREAERLAAQQDYPGAEDALRAAIILAPSETSYQERLAIIQEAVDGTGRGNPGADSRGVEERGPDPAAGARYTGRRPGAGELRVPRCEPSLCPVDHR